MNYLITSTDISDFEDVSVNIKEKRMQTDIRFAHDLDLKGFLGAAFYFDVLENIKFKESGIYDPTTTDQLYKDLYEGVKYENKSGNMVSYEGLKPMLVYFAFARFIKLDKYRFTASGPVAKHHDHSDGLTQKEIIMLTEQARSTANAYANNVENFLNDNKKDYPLWRPNQRNKESRQPGPRIRSVDRTDYNLGTSKNFNNRFGLDLID